MQNIVSLLVAIRRHIDLLLIAALYLGFVAVGARQARDLIV